MLMDYEDASWGRKETNTADEKEARVTLSWRRGLSHR
jgi:hypothetical protein